MSPLQVWVVLSTMVIFNQARVLFYNNQIKDNRNIPFITDFKNLEDPTKIIQSHGSTDTPLTIPRQIATVITASPKITNKNPSITPTSKNTPITKLISVSTTTNSKNIPKNTPTSFTTEDSDDNVHSNNESSMPVMKSSLLSFLIKETLILFGKGAVDEVSRKAVQKTVDK
jgi:hypothetical protein